MSAFTQAYVGLLIQQYFEQPHAAAEISAQATTWEKVRDILAAFRTEFDLDIATGDRLDKIGKLVGLPRADRIEFKDDGEYRTFLKLQISINNGSALMVSDDRTSIQSVIQFAFDNRAFVLDNKDMTLTLYVSSTFDAARLLLIIELSLLPKPQGVGYLIVQYSDPAPPFGFSELGSVDPVDAGTYSELVYAPATGGIYSELFET